MAVGRRAALSGRRGEPVGDQHARSLCQPRLEEGQKPLAEAANPTRLSPEAPNAGSPATPADQGPLQQQQQAELQPIQQAPCAGRDARPRPPRTRCERQGARRQNAAMRCISNRLDPQQPAAAAPTQCFQPIRRLTAGLAFCPRMATDNGATRVIPHPPSDRSPPGTEPPAAAQHWQQGTKASTPEADPQGISGAHQAQGRSMARGGPDSEARPAPMSGPVDGTKDIPSTHRADHEGPPEARWRSNRRASASKGNTRQQHRLGGVSDPRIDQQANSAAAQGFPPLPTPHRPGPTPWR